MLLIALFQVERKIYFVASYCCLGLNPDIALGLTFKFTSSLRQQMYQLLVVDCSWLVRTM